MARNLEALLEAGVHGFVATGTMGEAGSLTAAERRTVVETTVAAAAGRVPVIAGVASGTPGATIGFAADAAAAGADAIMLLPPLGYRADAREVIAWYRTVADGDRAADHALQQPRGERDRPAARADQPDRRGGRPGRGREGVLGRRAPDRGAARQSELEVLVGGDDWALEGFCAGATGWVTGVGDCAPAECVELYEACGAADLERARAIYARLLPLARLDMTPKLVQYFKGAQDALGFTGGPVRPPRLELDEQDRVVLAQAVAALSTTAVA